MLHKIYLQKKSRKSSIWLKCCILVLPDQVVRKTRSWLKPIVYRSAEPVSRVQDCEIKLYSNFKTKPVSRISFPQTCIWIHVICIRRVPWKMLRCISNFRVNFQIISRYGHSGVTNNNIENQISSEIVSAGTHVIFEVL